MAVFSSQITTALRLITEKGESSTIEREQKVAGTKSWKPGVARINFPGVRAVWLNFNLGRIDGERIKEGDQKVLVAASGLSITPDASNDTIIRANGERWSIQTVKELNPNGEAPIIYTLQVRV